jgi:nucleoid-associated protein YgaU
VTKRTWTVVSLALVSGIVAGGCAKQKSPDEKVPLERGVTDVAPASAVPPDPSYVSGPPTPSYPMFVPVDAPPDWSAISANPAGAPAVTQTPGAYAPSGGRHYLVQKGDTLFRIAKVHYGDGNRWQQIAMANPGLTPTSLKAGSTIVVP